VIGGSVFLPWIDHVDSGSPEVFGFSSGCHSGGRSVDLRTH